MQGALCKRAGAATPETTSFAKRYSDADGSARRHCHLCFVSLIGQTELPPRPAWFVLRLKESEVYGPCSGNCVSGRTMIATCANPACNEPFRYFRSGKIFMLEANDLDPGSKTDPSKRGIEYFWLCGACAPAMHLMRTTDGVVALCQSPRPSDPHGALRIVFAREITSLGLKHRRFSGIST